MIPRLAGEGRAAPADPSSLRLLLLVSVASLYAELVLIRWISTEIRVFAFVQNLALIACFLGFGVGCFRPSSSTPTRRSLMPTLYALATLSAIVSLPVPQWQGLLTHLSDLLSQSPDYVLWGMEPHQHKAYVEREYFFGIFMMAALLWLVARSMVPLGQWVGLCFDNAKDTVRAYSVNLVGSLVGAWLLVILAALQLGPVWWIALAFLFVLLATPRSGWNWLEGGLVFAFTAGMLLSHGSGGAQALWSPYQKIIVNPLGPTEYQINVNNSSGYMSIADATPAFLFTHPHVASYYRDSVYDSPFRFVKKGARVLIVGAGAGNDAAAALRNGAAHVDAVEIDPMIYKVGKSLHPEHPYDSPRVEVIVTDARNFMRVTDRKYDAIIFGLLDTLTEVSGYSNMRMDNYVYTRESFAHARRLLNPDGVLILKFEVRAPWEWIGQRFYRTLSEVFGREPVVWLSNSVGNMWRGNVFVESDGDRLRDIAKTPEMELFLRARPPAYPATLEGAPAPSSDDWPYPYSRERAVPRTYLVVSAILLALAGFMVRNTLVVRARETWVMFMLGAGFMLLETQLISRLSLYFGTTWIVSGIAISIVLAVLVAANLVVERRRAPVNRPLCLGILIGALLLNYLFPWDSLPLPPRAVGALLAAAYGAAVFMAGLVFTTTLRGSEKKSSALGANVLGAVAGGLLQNLSFIIGLKALLLPVAGCYAAAAVFMKARRA